ncbi:MAG TPA: ATP-NAD kinase, partial [Clostridiales bacterium]|nr:ATP-NAD kinase [Clostridiales bacterium]
SIASHVVQNMEKDCLYIIGPGTTTRGIMEMLGLPNTLLGVDVVCNKQLVASDANEEMLLKLVEGKKAKIVVTIIGGQGYIFGRGNQQISHRVIRSVGFENILVISTESKLLGLKGSPLLVDTGDLETDKQLAGYTKVVTGLNKYIAYKIAY